MPLVYRLPQDGRDVVLARYVDHDPKSWDYPAAAGPVASVDWQAGPNLDQGATGSCTGNAAVDCLNSLPAHVPGSPYLTEQDALKVYSMATRLDRVPGVYPPSDTGSTGLAAAKACVRLGLIGKGGYSHAFGISHLLGALQHGPVMVGTDWTQGMFTPDPSGVITPTGSVAGGHEYEVRAYDEATQLLTIRNSWGTSWGLGGDARIHVSDMSSLLDAHGDVTVLRPAAA